MVEHKSQDSLDTAAMERSKTQSHPSTPAEPDQFDPEQDAKDIKQERPQDAAAANDQPLSLHKLFFIGIGLWCAVFLVSLDQTIVANAIPSITGQFQKISDVGWYGSGYLLTMASFQLFYGRLYSNFSIKYTFLTAISIFELGSLVCGLAPTSTALIVGRAVAGLGSAGIASGAMIIIAYSVPIRLRPVFLGSLGAVFAIASVLGPVLGGLLTTRLSWRWCFYINLPFGGATILAVFFFVSLPDRPELERLSLKEKLKNIDFIGLLLLIPSIVCLLLALQWGGSTYPWSDSRIVALFVLFGVLILIFLMFEYWKGAQATLPLRILARRSVAAATWNGFCNGAAFLTFIYYIPFWHQVIRDVSALESGIRLLPFIIGVVIMAMLSGLLVSKLGYYAPMMILGSAIAPIGEGLLTTWTVDTNFSQWVGYQALTGVGIGLGQQQPMIAMQTVLPKADIPTGSSFIMLVQTLGGTIFVTVGQSVLQNELQRNLNAAFPGGNFDFSGLVHAGATQVRSLVPPQDIRAVLVAYNGALTKVYTVGLCMSTLTMIGSLAMEWRSVKKVKEND